VQVTGSPFVREASLDATNRALLVSLPIAVLLCLSVAAGFLRSIRYGLASVVPILMVVAWLYAFMELAGFSINLVTATIAAVSIGIGIDFAIHFIARYREELVRHGRRDVAIRVTGEGTGLALVASAASSAVGFAILALAPMPLFASYGLLTALMIVMALVATLAVLPSLLVLITSDDVAAADGDPARSASGGAELFDADEPVLSPLG
ncbi:MAG: MMPL family transporter, partial [Actinomycetota bacterium]